MKPVRLMNENGIDNGIDDLDDEQRVEPHENLLERLVQQRAAMFVREYLRRARLEAGGALLDILDEANNGDSARLWVAGWGSTDEYGDSEFTSEVLRKVAIKLQRHAACLNAYGDDSYFPERNLCASDSGKCLLLKRV
jgi:hypothetical protein